MKKFIIALAGLLICGSVFADVKSKPVPKAGAVPVVRPFPGKYYWKHPTYGWGNYYYPAPVAPIAQNYYLDEYGRVVPNGYVYDINGNLVPVPVVPVVTTPEPYYPGYYYRRWGGWWR